MSSSILTSSSHASITLTPANHKDEILDQKVPAYASLPQYSGPLIYKDAPPDEGSLPAENIPS